MRRGPQAGKVKTDFVANAHAAWGVPPGWVLELAEFAKVATLKEAGRKIGYSSGLVSQVISHSYGGDLNRVEQKVRGALMGETVVCPVIGAIGRDQCLDEQKKPFSATSAIRVRIYHECRSGCTHSRIPAKGGA